MKKLTMILAMLLIAATSYNQSSRRTANEDRTAQRTNTRTSNTSDNSSSQARNNNSRSGNRQTETTTQNRSREATTSTNQNRSETRTANNRSNTQTSRSDNQRTYNRSGRSEKPQTVQTNHHRSTSDHHSSAPATHVRHARPSRNVHNSSRQYRSSHTVVHHYRTPPRSRTYRAHHYVYREPVSVSIIWTPALHRHYVRMYPMVRHWNYHHGYRISNVSAYYADHYMGEVMTVYGRVKEVFYSITTDEYFLYFGAYYPYHDFTVVMPGWMARQHSRRPDRYFDNNYIAVTGLITSFEGKPEIVLKESFQLNLY